MANRKYDVTISAPGAEKIGVVQVPTTGSGGQVPIKNCSGSSCAFKTFGTLHFKRADNPAKIQIKVKWTSDAGGGEETFGPRKVGSSQTINLKTPKARAQEALAELTSIQEDVATTSATGLEDLVALDATLASVGPGLTTSPPPPEPKGLGRATVAAIGVGIGAVGFATWQLIRAFAQR